MTRKECPIFPENIAVACIHKKVTALLMKENPSDKDYPDSVYKGISHRKCKSVNTFSIPFFEIFCLKLAEPSTPTGAFSQSVLCF